MKISKRLLPLLILLGALLILVSCQKGAKTGDTAAAVVDSVASTDGVMIHYSVKGSGSPALVFIHGWCCDQTYWDKQVDFFAEKVKVVTIDLAGTVAQEKSTGNKFSVVSCNHVTLTHPICTASTKGANGE